MTRLERDEIKQGEGEFSLGENNIYHKKNTNEKQREEKQTVNLPKVQFPFSNDPVPRDHRCLLTRENAELYAPERP